ncbi:MAG: DsrH/TusB family sulfur metabolism protein [Nitrospiraceae bacterium]|nr:DsrH/TusB family sulfur relay protein [Nitrospirota bacterium]MDA8340299.1 DsrH/TusB family sulfur metabolism protein [Nitrospiraceae bacterium]
MLVIIKSSPDTQEGKRGVKLARDMAADICLIQNAVYFAQKERLEGFCGTAFILDEDARLRGLGLEEIGKGIREINYEGLVDLMVNESKVVGMF